MSNKLKQLSTEELATVCRGMIEARDKRLAELEARLTAVVHIVQRHQPAGSPPPGDLPILTKWIIEHIERERDEARRELTEERARKQ